MKANEDLALEELLDRLKVLDYDFVPPTPETHRRVVARPAKSRASNLRDVFGWSCPFERDVLAPELFALLQRSGMLRKAEGLFRSEVRIAAVNDRLFLHSAFPTNRHDSVFLGPDTYRFVKFLGDELPRCGHTRNLVDIGAGSGAGAISATAHLPDTRLILTDINPLALRLARINARHNGIAVEVLQGSGPDVIDFDVELVIANPPFILDAAGRAYRDGGSEMHGAALSLVWALSAATRLVSGGRMLLYTGSAIVNGVDALKGALRAQLPALGCTMRYAELDPDIFGEQLDEPGYEDVERIAAVGAVIVRTD